MTTTGLDLLGTGPTITLADGSTVALVYSFRSLALLEARFGGVAAVQSAVDSTGAGAAFGPLLQIVGAGCVGAGGYDPHVREYQDVKGARRVADITYRRRRDGVDLADLMEPHRLSEYADAMGIAMDRALQSPGNDPAPAVEMVTTGSPGLSASASPAVPSTFAPATSGA